MNNKIKNCGTLAVIKNNNLLEVRMSFFAKSFLVLTLSLFSAASIAQSAKATGRVGGINILDSSQMGWSTIMDSSLKMANKKELFIQASLECGLYTQTQVSGKKGQRDSSSASAEVKLRVLVDGQVVAPGEITYCSRSQELSAVLGGVLESCSDSNLDGTIEQAECEFSDEEIELVLKTMSANSFGFIAANLGAGDHRIQVQAKISSDSDSQNGSASALASIGHGSVLIEEVRAIQGDVFEF